MEERRSQTPGRPSSPDDGAATATRGFVIGLTGGIGTGKSTVARMFAQLGAVLISADEIAREVVQPGHPALAEIRAAFGDDILAPDGTLNRPALGAIVFADDAARRRLEGITHPHIRRVMGARIEEAVRGGRTVVAEIPLLIESEPAQGLVDVIVVVATDPDTQQARLMARDNLTPSEAQRRIQAQLPLAVKVAVADHVIDNQGTEAETRRQVEKLWAQLHSARGSGR